MAPDTHPLSDALYLQSLGDECRAFLYRAGALQDLAVWRDGRPLLGDLYLARVRRLERALGLAFCDLGEGPDGVLPLDQAPRDLTEGAALPVRLVRAAAPGKGPKLAPARLPRNASGQEQWQDETAPCLLQRTGAPLARFLEAQPAAVLIDSPDWTALLPRDCRPRLLPGGFGRALNNHLEGEVEGLLQPPVALAGGSLLIEPGATLTAIDVNLGAAGRGPAGRAAQDFNRLVLPEVARQIRLRALAGRILIDCLAPSGVGEARVLKTAMKEALAGDPERVEVKGMTLTGLLELTRRRGLFQPLHELLMEPYGPYGGRRLTAAAEAARLLRQLAAERRDQPAAALRLEVGDGLLALLERQQAWRDLRRASAALLKVVALPESGPERYRLDQR